MLSNAQSDVFGHPQTKQETAAVFVTRGLSQQMEGPLPLTAEENIKGDGFRLVALRLRCFRRHSSLPVIHFSHRC